MKNWINDSIIKTFFIAKQSNRHKCYLKCQLLEKVICSIMTAAINIIVYIQTINAYPSNSVIIWMTCDLLTINHAALINIITHVAMPLQTCKIFYFVKQKFKFIIIACTHTESGYNTQKNRTCLSGHYY